MKFFTSMLALLLTLMSFSFGGTKYDGVEWGKFSSNIEVALNSENTGLKQSAIHMLYKYTEYLNVKNAVNEVMEEYVYSNDQQTRKLALVTLYKMQDEWALALLKSNNRFEKDESIKKCVDSIVEAVEKNDEITATKIASQVYAGLDF